jgi:hypothetical protein
MNRTSVRGPLIARVRTPMAIWTFVGALGAALSVGCSPSLPADADGGAGAGGHADASGSKGGSGGGAAGSSGGAGRGATGGSGTGGASGTGGEGVAGAVGTGGASASGAGGAAGMGAAGSGGAAATGGAAGIAGAVGTGGAGAKGGAGGAAGTKGTGGTSGAAGMGSAGSGGTAGSSGVAGSNGVAGAGGVAGSSGVAGAGGAAGAPGCAAGFSDCDGLTINGCETETRNNTAHCGACTTTCKAGSMCFNGTCSTTALAFEGPEGDDGRILTYGSGELSGSIAVDASDVPYVGYSIWYAVDQSDDIAASVVIRKRTAPNTWTTVSNGPVGGGGKYSVPSLANGPGKSICYAVASENPDNFDSACVGTSGSTIIAPAPNEEESVLSFQVDPLGTPILADASGDGLAVTYTSTDTVDTGPNAILQLDLRQAPSGALHVAYLLPTSAFSSFNEPGVVRHAVWNGATWSTDTVDTTAVGAVGCVSLAVDSQSQPHVLYGNTTTGTIMLADWNATSSTWQTKAVRKLQASLGETAIFGCALALDAADVPHVIFQMGSDTQGEFGYGIYNGTDWSFATVPETFSETCNARMELVLDSHGVPNILFSDCGGASAYGTME